MNLKTQTHYPMKRGSHALLLRERTINTEFSLFLGLIWEIFLYLLLLIPRLLGLIFYFFMAKKEKSKELCSSLFSFPFLLVKKLSTWFFQAKYTAFLFFFLILVFTFQLLYLNTSPYLEQFMTNPQHLFEGNYYSIITSIFLHADIFHLFGNLLALLIFGRVVEKHLKSSLLWIFLIGGVLANLVSHFISYLQGDYYFSLGASGGIAALIMLGILFEPFVFTSFPLLIPLPLFCIGWMFIFLDLIGLTNPSEVNHIAHLGGYAAVLLLLFFMRFSEKRKIYKGFLLNSLLFIFLALIFVFTHIQLESVRIFLLG